MHQDDSQHMEIPSTQYSCDKVALSRPVARFWWGKIHF